MADHFASAHEAERLQTSRSRMTAIVLDDGSKIILESSIYSPYVFRTVIGGCFSFEFERTGANEIRFGVRQLGRGPPRHRLASVMVRFGPADGLCVQFPLSRVLTAEEHLRNDALCAGTPPAVMRVDPIVLSPTLAIEGDLVVSFTLTFRVAPGGADS